MQLTELIRTPDRVSVLANASLIGLTQSGDEWAAGDIHVAATVAGGELRIAVGAASTPVERVHLRWRCRADAGIRILGDAWERGYGDLEWRGLVAERVLPWYFLAHAGDRTGGCGVKTGAGAFCSWRVDESGVSLWLDVRSGAAGVALEGRILEAAVVVALDGEPGQLPMAVASRLCRLLCDAPLSTPEPVYGSNNWYYAYGHSSHEAILADTDLLVSLAPDGPNRPFMTIDDGWEVRSVTVSATDCGAPWDRGNEQFPDMPGLAAAIRARGARAGIWIRPLGAAVDTPASMLLPVSRAVDSSATGKILDPSIPENLERIASDVSGLRAWGYELIKHDWTTCDILGRWGFDMGSEMTSPGWRFADGTRTTAEIIGDLYRAIRRGAGDAVLIGCNTVGHLGAGLFELQRTGDDTSGREWERTRKMGVNTLAFRMPQQGAFFQADADCVGLTTYVPWHFNRQWLDLLSRSGTPLFVSASPVAMGAEQTAAVRKAFARAATLQAPAEPLDCLDTTCPSHWRFADGDEVRYDWFGEGGIETG
jgi:alpha-galactosidase